MVFLTFFLGELTVPAEIRARGVEAERAFQRALQQNETVNVCRGRVMIVGQERAGKTSLKKSLLGMPFNKEEESTVGIEVDPSKFEVNVDQVSTPESIRGMRTGFQRKDFWDRSGGQGLLMIG